jgi:hypothetical protein
MFRSTRGQGTVEYMLVISVLVVAMLTIVAWFSTGFEYPLAQLGARAETVYTDASIAGP